MNDFIYFLKRWGIILVLLGLIFPIAYYFLEITNSSNKSFMVTEFLLALCVSLAISITGILIMVVCESLKRKSMRALLVIFLIGIFNTATGIVLIYAFPRNGITYFILLVGGVLIIQSFRIRKKIKTLM